MYAISVFDVKIIQPSDWLVSDLIPKFLAMFIIVKLYQKRNFDFFAHKSFEKRIKNTDFDEKMSFPKLSFFQVDSPFLKLESVFRVGKKSKISFLGSVFNA